MALTGFLAGFNEQREAEQKLESERALADYRASESVKNYTQIRADEAYRMEMERIFPPGARAPKAQQAQESTPPITFKDMTAPPGSQMGGTLDSERPETEEEGFAREKAANNPLGPNQAPPMTIFEPSASAGTGTGTRTDAGGGGGGGAVPPVTLSDFRDRQQELQLAERYDEAAQAAARHRKPGESASFANSAANIRNKIAHQESERLRIQGEQQKQEAARRESQASALGAINSQGNYRIGYETYLARGGVPIQGLTGEWQDDKPIIQYHAAAGMKLADQAKNEIAEANLLVKGADSERRQEQARTAAERAIRDLERKEADSDAKRKRDEDAAADRAKRTAAAQARLELSGRVNDGDIRTASRQFDSLIAGMEKPPSFDPKARADIVEKAAGEAKRKIIAGSKEDFADLVTEEIQNEMRLWARPGMRAFPGTNIRLPWAESLLGTKPHLVNPNAPALEGAIANPEAAAPSPSQPVPNQTPGGAATGVSPSSGPTAGKATSMQYYMKNKDSDPTLREKFKERYGHYPD